MKSMNDPFEPTPEGFHRRIEQKLNELQRAHAPVPRPHRLATVLALCVVLLCGTALALRPFGVLDFLTARFENSVSISGEAVVIPTAQSCDSQLLAAQVQDACWDGVTLSVSVSVRPLKEYALCMETEIGADGETYNRIWRNGESQLLEDWLAGREAMMLFLPEMTLNGVRVSTDWDWVSDEQGETLLLQVPADDMVHETELSIPLRSVLLSTGAQEQATLYATLPAMTKEEYKP